MRQFLAIKPSAAMIDALRSLQDRLRRDADGWRWLDPRSIHLTLRFLGEVAAERDAALRAAILSAVIYRVTADGYSGRAQTINCRAKEA